MSTGKEGKYGPLEALLASHIVGKEYAVGKQNNSESDDSFQQYVDLLDARRTEKDYDWMSDIRLPQFASIMLTQSSIDVSQYFMTREFVECYVQDSSEEAKKAAAASKELINRTLNQKHLNHYLKFVRAKQIAHLNGAVWSVCWWDKLYNEMTVKVDSEVMDGDGTTTIETAEEKIETVVVDRFNYDIVDPRNVFCSPEFTYTAQDKQWVIIRNQKTIHELRESEQQEGYFNLDLIDGKGLLSAETETARNTNNQNSEFSSPDTEMSKSFDILKRYGRFWAIVEERDQSRGFPLKIRPGIDDSGKPTDDSELVECIITFATDGSTSTLIGFYPTPYVDVMGNPYKPLIRGQCYPHPVADGGFGDGRHALELQKAIDDTFNMTNDRTRLATMPVLKVKRYANEGNDTIYFEPGHKMELDDPTNDVQELVIRDNIQGGLAQLDMLVGGLQTLTSIYPTTMGNTPADSSTTATAIAGSEQRSTQRGAFKAKTFEYTDLTELYWMINHMTFTFAEPETGMMLMGDKVYDFNPNLDFFYKPLSQSIESDQSKQQKIQRWIQLLGYISNMQDPRIASLFVFIVGEIAKLMGDEVENVMKILNAPPRQHGQAPMPGAPAQQPSLTQATTPVSNQNGVPQSLTEMNTRELPAAMMQQGAQ